MAVQSVLGGWGLPKSPYGSFAGKVEAVDPKAAGPFTVMSGWGHPKAVYGSFAGKVEADVAAGKSTPFLVNVGTLMNR